MYIYIYLYRIRISDTYFFQKVGLVVDTYFTNKLICVFSAMPIVNACRWYHTKHSTETMHSTFRHQNLNLAVIIAFLNFRLQN